VRKALGESEDIYELLFAYLDESRTQERKKMIKSKYLYGSIGLCIIVGLILIGGVIVKLLNDKRRNDGILLGKHSSFLEYDTENCASI
jgi:hypothetical protein